MNIDRVIKDVINYQSPVNNDALVIYIPKVLGAIEAISLRQASEHICESNDPPSKITLDFSRTSFLDSSGIGALASIIRVSKITGIELTVCGLTPQVYSVLKMTRLDRLLSIDITEIDITEAIEPETAIEESRESG